MKNVNAVEVYNLLKNVSLTGMSFKGQRAILKNLRELKPISENYTGAVQEAQEKLKPENFEMLEQKANMHNEAVRNGSEEGRLQGEELQTISTIYAQYNQAFSSYINELNEEEVNIALASLNDDDFEKLVMANDKAFDAGKLSLLDEFLCS